MDFRSSQVYSDVLREDAFVSGTLSARDTYGLPKPPMFVYDPYASELDQLDKTLFLERRMRIQENIINRHKTDAERARDKNGKVLTKNQSSDDMRSGKKTYSNMFNSKQSGNLTDNTHTTNEGIWVPKEAPVHIQGNVLDYPVVETLDTARGKARYALVRINSTGSSQLPQMFVESVHSIDIPKRNSVDSNVVIDQPFQSGYSKVLRTHDPNNFIGPDNQAILEKVNGNSDFKPFDVMQDDTSKSGDKAGKKLAKKNSKITLIDLNEEEEIKRNHLTSRKTKQSLKASSRENGFDKIGRQDLDNNKRDSRHPSRDTNLTGSRKGSLNTSRQSSWSKHSQATVDTPLSFNTVDSFNGSSSPTHKRGRHRKLRKHKHIIESNTKDVSEDQIPVKKNDNKQTPQTHEAKTNIKEKSKVSLKTTKLNEAKNKHQEVRPPKSQVTSSVTTDSSFKDNGKIHNTQDVNKSKNKTVSNDNKSKQNENKGYAAKHRGLRKTESFKIMGNSSHFFGYVSAEQEEVKKPKSILKKPKSDPDRPDTA